MAAMHVLVFSASELTVSQRLLRDELLSRLDAEPRVEFASVTLPRAEAMLVPRLIGLWTVLVFVGGSGDCRVPLNPVVLDSQVDLFDELPPLAIVGHPGDLWPDWDRFQSHLYRSGADRTAVEVEVPNALSELWERIMTLPTPSRR
jgi:hypothetical protein